MADINDIFIMPKASAQDWFNPTNKSTNAIIVK
jgi:hypothetical protein